MRNHTLAITALGLVMVITSPAQTFSVLTNFHGTDGANPVASLVQSTDGDYYGTTSNGGDNNFGTIFKINAAGKLTMLHSFNSTDGAYPNANLIQATDGSFYGTTWSGGNGGYGTIFKILLAGQFSIQHYFDSTNGANPQAGLIQASNGLLYGAAVNGGTGDYGTIFKTTLGGTLTTLLSFNDLPGGAGPWASLIQGADGNFYGTTSTGGEGACYGCGTVFKMTPAGMLTTLHTFAGTVLGNTDGSTPYGALIQAPDGWFYGTASNGGTSTNCGPGCGVIFRVKPGSGLTIVHSFDKVDGAFPMSGLIQATDGNFYGTTNSGGTHALGTVFRLTQTGGLKTLHNFDSIDGAYLYGGLLEGTDGYLYGTTSELESSGYGNIFRLSVGLSPFVKTLPSSGKIGAAVQVLGTDLTGTTSVTFNGTPATFSVKSSALVTATIPSGATTGKIMVITPSGKLISNVPFRVRP